MPLLKNQTDNFILRGKSKQLIEKFGAAGDLHLVDINYKQSNRCIALLFSSLTERSRLKKQIIFSNEDIEVTGVIFPL